MALRKLTARVFGASRGAGGNPVTIFIPKERGAVSSAAQLSLAQSCEWESVLIHPGDDDVASFQFFVPSGNEMSFCAHAAMGAAYVLHRDTEESTISFSTSSGERQMAHVNVNGKDDTVFLNLNHVPYQEKSISLLNAECLLDQVGLDMTHVLNHPLNAAIAGRPKTLIQVPLAELQIEAHNPSSPKDFQGNCFMARESTGLYLYAHDDDDDGDIYECRQFPNASGYPEDPATGIAAAALAVHLHKSSSSTKTSVYDIRQGTAMGRPSQISIQDIVAHDEGYNTVSLQCGGRVEIDSEEEIRV